MSSINEINSISPYLILNGVRSKKTGLLTNELFKQLRIHNGFISSDQRSYFLSSGISEKMMNAITNKGFEQALKLLGGDDQKESRSVYTQRLVGVLNNEYNDAYNIVVFRKGHNVKVDIPHQDIIDFGTKREDEASCLYQYFIFKKGTIDNHGDGGYINWAFCGNFTRNGGRVTFKPR